MTNIVWYRTLEHVPLTAHLKYYYWESEMNDIDNRGYRLLKKKKKEKRQH